VGGRRQVAWYVAQAADAQAMMPARGDVARLLFDKEAIPGVQATRVVCIAHR
jgi:hypothetical protein